jgi:hypothetical protein
MGMTTKQLKKVIGDDALTNPASLPVRWGRFVAMVGEAYAAFDADRDILERSMHLAADDLEARNRQLFMTNPRPAKVEQAKAANLAKSEFLAILNDILDLSKIEANKLEIERIACDPSAIVNEAVSLMRVRAREKNLQCEIAYLGPIPQTIKRPDAVEADIARLRKLLHDLKGTCGLFGLGQISELAIRSEKQLIETAAIGSTAADIQTIIDMLSQAAKLYPARFPARSFFHAAGAPASRERFHFPYCRILLVNCRVSTSPHPRPKETRCTESLACCCSFWTSTSSI